MKKIIAAAALAVTLTGCAFNAQKATLAPTLEVESSSQGAGVDVGLRVVDDRPSRSLGRRGNAYGAAAEITTDQDVAALIHEKVAYGLERRGFRVVDPAPDNDASLTLELRALSYSTSQGFWTGGIHVDGALKAIAGRANAMPYEKTYRVDDDRRAVVVPTADRNEEMINQSLSGLLREVFADVGLFRFLAGEGSSARTASVASD